MEKVVLIVEDDADYRSVIVELVSSAGYKTLEASHGREALDILAANHVDIVLSDIQMPVMNGMEMLKHIQTLTEDRPKVVMMSGYSVYTKDEAISAGAETLVEKPGSSQSLLAILSSIRFF